MKKRCTSYMNLYSSRIPHNMQVNLMKLDPTGNECNYIDWIFKQHILGLKEEDYYKLVDGLKQFNEEKNRLAMNLRDINKYKTYGDLLDMLDEQFNMGVTDIESNDDIDVKVIYDGILGKLSIPLTKEASCKLGKGTRWCTAAEESNNMFDEYNKNGQLYVWYDRNWNKGKLKELGNKSKKFQFHFSHKNVEFDDEKDVPIKDSILIYFRNFHPVLSKLFHEHEVDMENKIIDMSHNVRDILFKSTFMNYIDKYIIPLNITDGLIYNRIIYNIGDIPFLFLYKVGVSSFEEWNGRSDIDDMLDMDDDNYISRCNMFPTYIKKNVKVWNDEYLHSIYKLLIEKDSSIPESVLDSNPYIRLYYQTYIVRKKSYDVERLVLQNINKTFKYINANQIIYAYLSLYSDEDSILKPIHNIDLFHYYNRRLSDEEVVKMQQERANAVLAHKILAYRDLTDLIDYTNISMQDPDEIEDDKIRRVTELNNVTYVRYWTDEELEEYIQLCQVVYPYDTYMEVGRHITTDALKNIFKVGLDSYKYTTIELISRRGEMQYILDNMDYIIENKKNLNYSNILVNIWYYTTDRKPSKEIETSLIWPISGFNTLNNIYYRYVTNGLYLKRAIHVPVEYMLNHEIL